MANVYGSQYTYNPFRQRYEDPLGQGVSYDPHAAQFVSQREPTASGWKPPPSEPTEVSDVPITEKGQEQLQQQILETSGEKVQQESSKYLESIAAVIALEPRREELGEHITTGEALLHQIKASEPESKWILEGKTISREEAIEHTSKDISEAKRIFGIWGVSIEKAKDIRAEFGEKLLLGVKQPSKIIEEYKGGKFLDVKIPAAPYPDMKFPKSVEEFNKEMKEQMRAEWEAPGTVKERVAEKQVGKSFGEVMDTGTVAERLGVQAEAAVISAGFGTIRTFEQMVTKPVETAKGFYEFMMPWNIPKHITEMGRGFKYDPAGTLGGLGAYFLTFKGAKAGWKVTPKIKVSGLEQYKGLYLEYGREGTGIKYIAGKTPTGLVVGTPKFKLIKLTELPEKAAPPESVIGKPSMKMKPSGLKADIAKRAIELEPREIKRIGIVQDTLKKLLKETPRPVKKPVFPEETKTLGKEVKYTEEWIGKEKGVAYGSHAAAGQIEAVFRRKAADVDVQFQKSLEQTVKITEPHVTQLRQLGKPVRMSKEQAPLVEIFEKGKTAHAIDIHTKEGAADYGAIEGAWGFRFERPTLKVKGGLEERKIKAMSLEEHILRKGTSAISLSKRGVAPEPHRLKDIADYYQGLRAVNYMKEATAFKKTFTAKEWAEIEKIIEGEGLVETIPEYPSSYKYPSPKPPSLYTVSRIEKPIEVEAPSPSMLRPSPSVIPTSLSPSQSISGSYSPSSIQSISSSISGKIRSSGGYGYSPSVSQSLSLSVPISKSASIASKSVSPSKSASLSPSPYISPSPYYGRPPPSPPSYAYPSRPSKSISVAQRFAAYDVFVRRAGKFMKVTKKPLAKEAARAYGAQVVETTPAATFKIIRSGYSPKQLGKFGAVFRPERFYRKGKLYIEKPRFRITPGTEEITGITMKGIEAARKRKKKPKLRKLFGL